MFDTMVASHAPGGRRLVRTVVVTTSVVAHVAVVATLAIVAMWRIDKLEVQHQGVTFSALKLPHDSGGGAAPAAKPLEARKEPEVVKLEPKVPVQPAITKEEPKPDSQSEGAAAVGTGDATAAGNGTGGDGKGLDEPTGPKCVTDACLGGGGGGEVIVVTKKCPKGTKLIEGECIKDKVIQTIAPDVAAGLRTSGNDQIAAPQSVRVAMMHAKESRVVGTVKLCIGTDGKIDRAQLLKSTGYDAYDDKLLSEMRAWRYQPYTVDGEAMPACTAVTVVYVMKK